MSRLIALGALDDGPAARILQEHYTQEIVQDKLRVYYLKSLPSGDPDIVQYAIALRAYGLGSMLNLHRKGQLHGRVDQLFPQVRLPSVPSSWEFPPTETLIFLAVYGGIDIFVDQEVLQDGWNPDLGRTIRTHFVNKSCGRYVDEYRKAYRIAKKFDGEPVIELDVSMELDVIAWLQSTSLDPERVIVDRDTIRRLLAEARHAKVAEIIYGISVFQETYKEIARRVNMTEEAVAAALRRFRADVSRHRPAADSE